MRLSPIPSITLPLNLVVERSAFSKYSSLDPGADYDTALYILSIFALILGSLKLIELCSLFILSGDF